MVLNNIFSNFFKKLDWTKFARLILIILGILSIIFNLASALHQYPNIQLDILNPHYKKDYRANALVFIINYFSNYVVQTAVIVIVWFIISLLLSNKEGEIKILQSGFVIAICIYTTITMFSYLFITLPTIDFAELEKWFNKVSNDIQDKKWFYLFGTLKSEFWITKMIQAVILPLSLNIYFIFFMKDKTNFNLKIRAIFKSKFALLIWIYPFFYLLIGLVWSEIKYQLDLPAPFIYFFFDLRNFYFGTYGYVWLILIIFFSVLLFSLLLIIYIYLNNEHLNLTKKTKKRKKTKTISPKN